VLGEKVGLFIAGVSRWTELT